MQPFKFFLAPLVDVPDDVLEAAGARLKRYLDSIIDETKSRMFSHSTFKLSPHAAEVGTLDLLAYITQRSLIVGMMNQIFEPDVKHSLPGTPGGGTKKMPDGAVLSEVFWTGGYMELRTTALRGTALANAIFHEFVHNKHVGDPTATRGGEEPKGTFVHTQCGGGILQDRFSIKGAAQMDINSHNRKCMARVLDRTNKQETLGLYDDDCGF
jgi:hypothetical protein